MKEDEKVVFKLVNLWSADHWSSVVNQRPMNGKDWEERPVQGLDDLSYNDE